MDCRTRGLGEPAAGQSVGHPLGCGSEVWARLTRVCTANGAEPKGPPKCGAGDPVALPVHAPARPGPAQPGPPPRPLLRCHLPVPRGEERSSTRTRGTKAPPGPGAQRPAPPVERPRAAPRSCPGPPGPARPHRVALELRSAPSGPVTLPLPAAPPAAAAWLPLPPSLARSTARQASRCQGRSPRPRACVV